MYARKVHTNDTVQHVWIECVISPINKKMLQISVSRADSLLHVAYDSSFFKSFV